MRALGAFKFGLSLAVALGLASCGTNIETPPSSSASSISNGSDSSLTSARVFFDYQDFYSLVAPNPSGCAGDAENFYDSLALTNSAQGNLVPAVLPENTGSTSGTVRPAFIKNISVDVTDANSTAPTNLAFSCSYGSGTSTVPTSSCATFDYGANDGVSSDLSGAVLLFGAIQGFNFSGINPVTPQLGLSASCGPAATGTAGAFDDTSCGTTVYALGVDALPASSATDPINPLVPGLTSASEPISSFVNLAPANSVSGPTFFLGGAGAYDPGVNSFALFGGTSVISSLSATGQSATNDVSWIFNLATGTWNRLAPDPDVDITLEETFEQLTTGTQEFLSNVVTGRASFGYTPAQGLSVDEMSTTGVIPAFALTGPVDLTDRIVIAGGQDAGGFVADTNKFNPTYAPEFVDTLGRSAPGTLTAGEPVQWLVNYHTSPLFNTDTPNTLSPSAELRPRYDGDAAPGPLTTNFGLTSLRNNTGGGFGSGYVLFEGGFDTSQPGTLPFNPSTDSCPGAAGSCGMMLSARTGRNLASGASANEADTANFSSVGNILFATQTGSTTTQLSPSLWNSYTGTTGGGPGGTSLAPWFGGSTLLPGFNINDNEAVFFGGATCEDYLLPTATNCNIGSNPGLYYTFGTDPVANPNGGGTTTIPTPTVVATSASVAPHAAGMASARGTDGGGVNPVGNPLIIAFGGMEGAGSGTDTTIYYLYELGGTPTWGNATVAGNQVNSPGPTVPTNGAMVYSHVTQDFYLFGGFSSVAGIMTGDTWQLQVTKPGCGVSATANPCSFKWTQLDVTGGLACSPSCPVARRSHRMAEVTYFNRNPGGTTAGDSTSGESPCTAAAPCSYAIFMEDGTADGVNPLSERWMFDPTANGGAGLWQKINEMPARMLSSMASADYEISSGTETVHRAVLFGGEAGLADPSDAASGNFFISPILGDTWMYDFDNSTWNRVELKGVGYDTLVPEATIPNASFNVSELSNRQAYDATNPTGTDPRSNVSELSPPPTSGAIMVTRTLSGIASSTGTPAPALKIPEIYLIGGRLKDGSFQALDHVYKFCAGSTGEAYTNVTPGAPAGPASTPNLTDLSCDAYDPVSNQSSPNPVSGYVGRWLRKVPATAASSSVPVPPVASALSSFMGAGAYDPVDDLILVFGGLQFNSANTAVTDTAQRTTQLGTLATPSIYEYTPPSATGFQGSWAIQEACAGSPIPTPRYGHSMIYNTQHQEVVVIGGYDVGGNQLIQSVQSAGGAYSAPDMWAGARTVSGSSICYTWRQLNTIGNSISSSQAPPMTGLSQMIAAYVPPSGYDTGYYSTFDSACDGVGPIASADPNVSKLLAGGVYFDIDRTQLGPNENLLLNLTFIPLGQNNQGPDASPLTQGDNAVFKIHLVATGQTQAELEAVLQPRYLTYTGNTSFPEIVQSLAVVSPPTGQIRQEQVVLPISANSSIDRIRIERTSGTAVLLDAALYRMGYK